MSKPQPQLGLACRRPCVPCANGKQLVHHTALFRRVPSRHQGFHDWIELMLGEPGLGHELFVWRNAHKLFEPILRRQVPLAPSKLAKTLDLLQSASRKLASDFSFPVSPRKARIAEHASEARAENRKAVTELGQVYGELEVEKFS